MMDTLCSLSMATSFTAAALTAEGVGRSCEMMIGNGFVPGHAELALDLVRKQSAVARKVLTVTTTRFIGRTILTGTPQRVDWVMATDDLISAVGQGEAPPADRTIDIDDGVLVPAFRDGHVHLQVTGLFCSTLDFRGCRDGNEVVARFASRAGQGDGILFGGNFEEPLDPPVTRLELDAAVGEGRAMLARADLHSCVVSTALLNELDLSAVDGVDRDARRSNGLSA